MPEGDVLHRRDNRHTHQTGQAGQVFGQNRVALVRHGRGAFLPLGEELFGFQNLGPLHVADFDGDVFDGGGDHPQRGKECGVTVAGDDLRADRLGLKAKLCADMLFHRRVDIGECAHRTGNRAGGNLGPCGPQTGQVAVHFGVEAGKGQAHGGRLGVDAVAAADAHRILVLERAAFQRGQQTFHIGDQDVRGAHQLNIERGVEHIRRRHALMNKARLVIADDLGQMGQKGDDVMFGHGLDLVDAGHVEFHILGLPDGFGILARDHAQIGLRVAGVGLDLVPDAELGLGGPDGDHVGAGISRDHQLTFFLYTVLGRGLRLGSASSQGRSGQMHVLTVVLAPGRRRSSGIQR